MADAATTTPTMSAIAVGGRQVHTVDAEELWRGLAIATRFDKWFARKLATTRFREDEDFWPNMAISTGGRPDKGFDLTVDMAKHLALMTKTTQGHAIRAHFIRAEQELRDRDAAAIARLDAQLKAALAQEPATPIAPPSKGADPAIEAIRRLRRENAELHTLAAALLDEAGEFPKRPIAKRTIVAGRFTAVMARTVAPLAYAPSAWARAAVRHHLRTEAVNRTHRKPLPAAAKAPTSTTQDAGPSDRRGKAPGASPKTPMQSVFDIRDVSYLDPKFDAKAEAEKIRKTVAEYERRLNGRHSDRPVDGKPSSAGE